ncbi:MAG TPA: sigma 54-interacting transcriptional regulator [Clostridia bacterium]|nr:sigma 54-interacting transcriptional regulator [Clostridia bacterium]
MEHLLAKAEKAAKTKSTVLIRGESGTGKELIARGIHAASSRWDGPFVAINCGAIPESLLESELFGYEDGAFTGAKKGGSLGKFELANQGTLFLDEIGDMSLGLQVKILRVLQEGTFVKIGGNKETKVNVRVIAATHRNLEGMVRNNLFRQDLYFRLNVIPLFVPPLRQRKEDIEPLLTYFLDYYNTKLDKNVRGFTPAVIQRLLEYHWPGNVRELQNAVEYAMNMTATDRITLECLPLFDSSLSYSEISELVPIDDAVESLFIKAFNTFGRSETGILKVAETLGVSRATVYRKMKKYGI